MKQMGLIILTMLSPFLLFSQTINEMEFINRPIQDIAFALSKAADINIIPDDTIKGSATFYFSGGSVKDAIDIFLNQNKLYLIEEENHFKLSRIQVKLTSAGLINLEAEDVSNLLLIKELSSVTKKTVLFDALPPDYISLHVKDLPLERILQMIITKHDDYYLEVLEGYYYIRHKPQDMRAKDSSVDDLPSDAILGMDDHYSLNIDQESFRTLLMQFFRYTGKEFIFLGQNNGIVENLYIKDKSFEETLAILLEQGDCEYRQIEETFYIFDTQRRNILDVYNSSALIELKKISAEKLMQIIPPSVSSKVTIKLNEDTNSVLLYGSVNEISRVKDFIAQLDNQTKEKNYYRYNLSFIETSKIQSLLPESLKKVEIITVPDTTSIIAVLPSEHVDPFSDFIKMIDKPSSTYQVNLRYIKAEDLLKTLPPSISKEEIVSTLDSNTVFFKGEESKYRQFMKELNTIDKPTPQIRYDILVIQYQENKKFNWNMDIHNSVLEADGVTSYLGKIGAVLDLSFDVTSAFGYQFSLDLSTDISQSNAKVMADSTLNALSGQQAKFQNTNTYRYRDTVKDSDTGNEEVTGVSREITSGLFVDLNGWVSGDDMITMDISTTFSKQESVSNDNSVGTLPPTSEKIIESHLRTEAGKPVVIGGLIQQELTQSLQKVPILGSIPFLGYLFQSKQENYENTEMVIYIIPYIEDELLPSGSPGARLDRYKERFGAYLEDYE